MNGIGKNNEVNGRVYIGNWDNGIINGQGIATWPDGKIYNGNWKNVPDTIKRELPVLDNNFGEIIKVIIVIMIIHRLLVWWRPRTPTMRRAR